MHHTNTASSHSKIRRMIENELNGSSCAASHDSDA
jgi:hypothetical protein